MSMRPRGRILPHPRERRMDELKNAALRASLS
jgi:hypothetical protein